MKNLLCFSLIFLISFQSHGRGVKWMGFEDMKEKADLIVIATPISTKETKEKKKLYDIDSTFNDTGTIVIGVNTNFIPIVFLKGEIQKDQTELILHHYKMPKPGAIFNGPKFVTFKNFKKNGYLMFLKKESDGRYAPVNGQYDPEGISIRELEGSVIMDLIQKNIDCDN